MGEYIWDWFLPIRPSQGDGARFPYNEELVKKLRKRARAVVTGQRVGKAGQRTAGEGGIEGQSYGGLDTAI